MQKGGEDEAKVPKITWSLTIVRWTESFEDFLHHVTGSRHNALSILLGKRHKDGWEVYLALKHQYTGKDK